MPIACASVWFRCGRVFIREEKRDWRIFLNICSPRERKDTLQEIKRLTALAERGIESNARMMFEARDIITILVRKKPLGNRWICS